MVFCRMDGDLTGSENPKEITIDKAKTVTAVFVKIQDPLVSAFLDLIMNYQVYCVINQEVC